MWISNIISLRFHIPTKCAPLCLLYVFLCAQEIVDATSNQPEIAANIEIEAAGSPIGKERIPEAVIVNTGHASRNVRSALPERAKFSCYECRIIHEDDHPCTNVTECGENEEKCHYIHGDLKISNEKSAKVTIAGCGHAPHTEISVHGHDLSLDIVYHLFDTCVHVNGTAKKIMKPHDIGNTASVFEGHTCTCKSALCNARNTLFPAGETNWVETAEAKGKTSTSSRIGAASGNVAVVMTSVYLLTLTNNIWKAL